MSTIQKQLAILRSLHEREELEFEPNPPATADQLRAAEERLQFEIVNGLRELWSLCNGAPYEINFFGVHSDEPSPSRFLSLEQAVQQWEAQKGADRGYEQESPRDPRIRAGWTHPRWLPFAEFNGFSTCVMVDRAPGPGGVDGQIIVYQHDPDAIYWVAATFEEFFRRSNEILKENDFIE